MDRVVLDASLVAKWYLKDEEEADEARDILEDYAQGKFEVVLPSLIVYELGNVLFVASVLRKRLGRVTCQAALKNFFSYPFSYEEPSFDNALKLAFKHKVSFYDACYITLAESLSCPFFTGDQRLYGKLKTKVKSIKSLKDY